MGNAFSILKIDLSILTQTSVILKRRERYSTSTNVKDVGAVAGRGSEPAVGFLRGEALPRRRFLLLFASKK